MPVPCSIDVATEFLELCGVNYPPETGKECKGPTQGPKLALTVDGPTPEHLVLKPYRKAQGSRSNDTLSAALE